MKCFYKVRILTIVLSIGVVFPIFGQEYDLLIKNGHLIDPKNGISQKMDIAVSEGKIVKVAEEISGETSAKIVDATGLYVTPGLIDIHVHVFWGTKPDAYISNSFTSLPPDGFTFRAGVTTVVDAGSAGWRNFRIFKEQTIDQSKTRVLAFLNIVGSGMKGGAIEQNLADMDPKLTGMVVRKYSEYVVGVKLAHYSGPEWDPVLKMVEAGKLADVPAMIDFGGNTPQLSLERLLMTEMRAGDIFTHCFANVRGRTAIVDENGEVRPYIWDAQKKGLIFDVGHGGGSFFFDQAVPAVQQGFLPNSISTDLHTGSMNGGMKDMLNVMSKMLNLGMPLDDVIDRSTWAPAQIINHEELGHLSTGACADIAVFSLKQGEFGFIDVKGFMIEGDQKLECELTVREGEVVWDLNGIASPKWEK